MIDGTWAPVSAEMGGQALPEESLRTIRLVLAGDTYAATVGGVTDRGTFTLDPTQRPAAMEITGTEGPNKGKTIPAIYELTGDTLKVCYNLGGSARPAAFDTEGNAGLFLAVYRREAG